MLAKLHTFSLLGIEAVPVDVEVDVSAATSTKTILVGLPEAAAFFAGHLEIAPTPSRLQELIQSHSHYEADYADVRGQESAKRALVIAAVGSHNLSMLGPPGSGEPLHMVERLSDSPAASAHNGIHVNPTQAPACYPPRASRYQSSQLT